MLRLGRLSRWALFIGPTCIVLVACSFAPKYHTPETTVPEEYKEGVKWVAARPADIEPRGEWWAVFNDPVLSDLEARLGDANQDLKIAAARYEQTRAELRRVSGAQFPSIGIGSKIERNRTSENVPLNGGGITYNDFQLRADMTYELDLWGRVRNSVAAAGSRAQASASDLASVNLSLQSELAMAYFKLRGLDDLQALADETVTAYTNSMELTETRRRSGLAADVDIDQARAQLETVRSQALEVRLARSQVEHAIAILVGTPPSLFTLPAEPLAAEVPVVDADIPSTLLQRRPDISAAERRVAAANSEIGVAHAAFFPGIGLSIAGGVESASFASLFGAPSLIWSFGASIAQAVFDGGRRDAVKAKARAAYDETVAEYRKSVLTAFGEVEDQLAAQRWLAEASKQQETAVTAADSALDKMQRRYKARFASYVDVLTAQNAALTARRSLVSLKQRRFEAAVMLTKALGGGWSEGAAIPVVKTH